MAIHAKCNDRMAKSLERKAMNTQTLETLPRNNDVAISTPHEIDLQAVIAETAKRKSKDGETFSNKKGKSSLFTAVCASMRSRLGLPKFNDDGTPARLSESLVNEIERGLVQFWNKQAASLVSYGEVVSFRKDVSAVKITDKGEAHCYLTATMKARRECSDKSELHRVANLQLAKAKKRMDYMLDNAGKFERDDFDTIRVKINALEKVASDHTVES